MGFEDLINQGKKYYENNKDEVNKYASEAQDAYATYNKTEGSFTDKAKGVFSEYQKNSSKSDKPDSDSKTEEKK